MRALTSIVLLLLSLNRVSVKPHLLCYPLDNNNDKILLAEQLPTVHHLQCINISHYFSFLAK